MSEYRFTSDQLIRLLESTVGLFVECRDCYTDSEEEAMSMAVAEVLMGLDAERELAEEGECLVSMQIVVPDPDVKNHRKEDIQQ